jgi:predicted transcriptional regulator of viral defense system
VKSTLGQIETQMIAYCHLRGLAKVQTGDLITPLGLSTKQERELLSRMARTGIIAKVRRGLYLVPSRLPLGGIWSPDEGLAINTLMDDRGATYQVCGPNAFNYHGFDVQVPARVYLYNNRVSGNRRVGAVDLTLIKVKPQRLGSTVDVVTASGHAIVYSSVSRSLVDAIQDWSRFGTLPQAYSWTRQQLRSGRIQPEELIQVAIDFANKGTIRRLGAFLEHEGLGEELLRRLQDALNPSRSTIAAVPGKPRRGTLNNRWGVICNDEW